jgi:hypothetical protein
MGRVELELGGGEKIICANQADAELVLSANRRRYEGDSGRKLPRRTLDALGRAGLNSNSLLYRSAMAYLGDS